jgi:hypothetical protein
LFLHGILPAHKRGLCPQSIRAEALWLIVAVM